MQKDNMNTNEPTTEQNPTAGEPTPTQAPEQVIDEPTNKVDEGKKNEPFATFNDEKSFMTRVNREGKKQVKKMLESLGIEDESALKEIIEAKKQQEEANKTELEKAMEKIAQMESQNKELAKAQKMSEAKMTALKLGVDAKKVDYLLKLVDMDDVEESITAILADMPEFKGQQQVKAQTDPKGGTDFTGGNADNKNVPLTKEIISKMSTKEVQARYKEVMEFLKNNKM
jgi:hypothetical protein